MLNIGYRFLAFGGIAGNNYNGCALLGKCTGSFKANSGIAASDEYGFVLHGGS
jgi:hypothetical protein